jgi:hypothetical protein
LQLKNRSAAMARYPSPSLKFVSDAELTEALARTPLDECVIWNGRSYAAQPGSVRDTAFGLISEVWQPIALRGFLTRAARITGPLGLNPTAVRQAVRMHQSARQVCYLLARRTLSGDYVAVLDVPHPSSGSRPLRAGDPILTKVGVRFDERPVAACDPR